MQSSGASAPSSAAAQPGGDYNVVPYYVAAPFRSRTRHGSRRWRAMYGLSAPDVAAVQRPGARLRPGRQHHPPRGAFSSQPGSSASTSPTATCATARPADRLAGPRQHRDRAGRHRPRSSSAASGSTTSSVTASTAGCRRMCGTRSCASAAENLTRERHRLRQLQRLSGLAAARRDPRHDALPRRPQRRRQGAHRQGPLGARARWPSSPARAAPTASMLREEAELLSTLGRLLHPRRVPGAGERALLLPRLRRQSRGSRPHLPLRGRVSRLHSREQIGAEVGATDPAMSGNNLILLEQYIDFFSGRTFRQTCWSRPQRAGNIKRTLMPDRAIPLHVSGQLTYDRDNSGMQRHLYRGSSGATITVGNQAASAAIDRLAAAFPETRTVAELAAEVAALDLPGGASDAEASILDALFKMILVGLVTVSTVPVRVGRSSAAKPVAWPLARADAAANLLWTTNPRHETVNLDVVKLALLPYLDGSHDREMLAQRLHTAVRERRGLHERQQDGAGHPGPRRLGHRRARARRERHRRPRRDRLARGCLLAHSTGFPSPCPRALPTSDLPTVGPRACGEGLGVGVGFRALCAWLHPTRLGTRKERAKPPSPSRGG